MDLWVRSQDKENLLKVDRLDINDNTIMANMKKYYSGCDYIILGEYNSSIRALEVLDEIERAIKCNCVVRDTNDEIINNILKEEDTKKFMAENLYIYHMPEE